MADQKSTNPIWASITDNASARDAVKMSGLPLLLIGATQLIAALVNLEDVTLAACYAVAGLVLIVIAFLVRAGRAGLVPFAAFVTLCAISVRIWSVVTVSVVAGGSIIAWVSLAIPIVLGILAISGLRGWWWLRQSTTET